MSKTTIRDTVKGTLFSFISFFLFLTEFLIAQSQNLEVIYLFFIIVSGTVLPLVYFRLKKGAKHSIVFTVSSAIVYVAVFVCAFRLLNSLFTRRYDDHLFLNITYCMNFLIFLGILAVDIVGLICSAIKKIFSKLRIKIFTANCTLHRITAILATVICVLCIYLLTGIFNDGVEEMLAASFIPSFFSSVYYLSKANSSNPKLYFYSLLISQAVIGTLILAYLLRNHTYSEISIAVYFSVVFIIIADAVQTFVLNKKNTTNCSTEDFVR